MAASRHAQLIAFRLHPGPRAWRERSSTPRSRSSAWTQSTSRAPLIRSLSPFPLNTPPRQHPGSSHGAFAGDESGDDNDPSKAKS